MKSSRSGNDRFPEGHRDGGKQASGSGGRNQGSSGGSGSMSVREAGRKGGQRVRELVEKGKRNS